MYEIVPSDEGLKLINQRMPNAELYTAIARTGSHHLNPYHNLTHELGVAYWAYSCWVNSERGPDDNYLPIHFDEIRKFGVPRLLFSSLFHDHNHSGGRTSDSENVARALSVFERVGTQKLKEDFGSGIDEIYHAIQCTEFTDGKFPKEPKTFIAKCVRDADLMSIYSHEGRILLLGLLKEMKRRISSLIDVMSVIDDTRKFLTEAIMYTAFGRYMRDHYLDECLEQFRTLLMETYGDKFKPVSLRMWAQAAGIDMDVVLADIAKDDALMARIQSHTK
jgi:hypothetical protein